MELKVYSNIDQILQSDLNQIFKFDSENIQEFFNDPFTFNIGLIKENDKVIGAGLIRVINELKMLIKPDESNFKKARIISTLLDESFTLSQCNEIMIEISQGGNHYINILEKHYNFYQASGRVLRLEK